MEKYNGNNVNKHDKRMNAFVVSFKAVALWAFNDVLDE